MHMKWITFLFRAFQQTPVAIKIFSVAFSLRLKPYASTFHGPEYNKWDFSAQMLYGG